MRRSLAAPGLLFALTTAVPGCSDFVTARSTPPRGSLGRELYSLICDRVGAQSLREDITGASYYGICFSPRSGHRRLRPDGRPVELTRRPLRPERGRQWTGNSVSIARPGQANRALQHRGRIRGARRRDRATPIVGQGARRGHPGHPDRRGWHRRGTARGDVRAGACGDDRPPRGPGADALEVHRSVRRPHDPAPHREALARRARRVQAPPPTRAERAPRSHGRPAGLPPELRRARGRAADPRVSAPRRLRELAPLAGRDRLGSAYIRPGSSIRRSRSAPAGRTPVPGAASGQFQQLLRVLHEELRTEDLEPRAGGSPRVGRLTRTIPRANIFSRPRGEPRASARGILFASLSASVTFASGASNVAAALRHPAATCARPGRWCRSRAGRCRRRSWISPAPPARRTASADLDPLGQFVTTDGKPPVPSPFYSVDGVDGTRTQLGRAVNGAERRCTATSTRTRRFLASVTSAQRGTALRPRSGADAGRLQQGGAPPRNPRRGGLPLLFGSRRTRTADVVKTYPPDPNLPAAVGSAAPVHSAAGEPGDRAGHSACTQGLPRGGLAARRPALRLRQRARRSDDRRHARPSSVQLVVRTTQKQLARLIGVGLQIKALADAHPEAHIPANSTLWDELFDAIAAIAARARTPSGRAASSKI